jgi:hypothetical protein
MALYLLLSSRSEFRLRMEGRVSGNVAAENYAAVAVGTAAMVYQRFLQVTTDMRLRGYTPADFQNTLPNLYDPNAAGAITQNKHFIVRAVQLLDPQGMPYDDNNPCPGGVDVQGIITGLAGTITLLEAGPHSPR